LAAQVEVEKETRQHDLTTLLNADAKVLQRPPAMWPHHRHPRLDIFSFPVAVAAATAMDRWIRRPGDLPP